MNLPKHWVKDENFVPFIQDENCQVAAKYMEHYGMVARVGRAALGALLAVSLIPLFSAAGREIIVGLLFKSIKHIHLISSYFPGGEPVNLFVSMAGNPAHKGHMDMIAKAVDRLRKEGYQIGQVRIALSDEAYLKQKVEFCNHEISRDPPENKRMFRVLLSRDQRSEFLNAAIVDTTFGCDVAEGSLNGRLKVFHICGADFAEQLNSDPARYKHVVIVTRRGEQPEGISEIHSSDYTRLIVENSDVTCDYSSSKVQSGMYELLPDSAREEFKKLHQAAQSNPALAVF